MWKPVRRVNNDEHHHRVYTALVYDWGLIAGDNKIEKQKGKKCKKARSILWRWTSRAKRAKRTPDSRQPRENAAPKRRHRRRETVSRSPDRRASRDESSPGPLFAEKPFGRLFAGAPNTKQLHDQIFPQPPESKRPRDRLFPRPLTKRWRRRKPTEPIRGSNRARREELSSPAIKRPREKPAEPTQDPGRVRKEPARPSQDSGRARDVSFPAPVARRPRYRSSGAETSGDQTRPREKPTQPDPASGRRPEKEFVLPPAARGSRDSEFPPPPNAKLLREREFSRLHSRELSSRRYSERRQRQNRSRRSGRAKRPRQKHFSSSLEPRRSRRKAHSTLDSRRLDNDDLSQHRYKQRPRGGEFARHRDAEQSRRREAFSFVADSTQPPEKESSPSSPSKQTRDRAIASKSRHNRRRKQSSERALDAKRSAFEATREVSPNEEGETRLIVQIKEVKRRGCGTSNWVDTGSGEITNTLRIQTSGSTQRGRRARPPSPVRALRAGSKPPVNKSRGQRGTNLSTAPRAVARSYPGPLVESTSVSSGSEKDSEDEMIAELRRPPRKFTRPVPPPMPSVNDKRRPYCCCFM
ncbi:hypothetical protein BIW11_14168 [Tropilaelaps mercedesae]|uniref:Uncharacterized protein n=1 Tax=Tropilaelaps mercedesae TaxID=418985 RepID=A0A1V9WZ83_9ACAR|nr:hypothetical protein BIW11_14168 [Tropilaelaps mercedesae]